MRNPERFRGVLPPMRFEEFQRGAEEARNLLAGRTVWNVNSTARGGGVVELLRPLVGYARGVGVDARWVVIDGSAAFYDVTKRIHNRLHGFDGDGGPLDGHARRIYEDTLAENAAAFARRVAPRRRGHPPRPAVCGRWRPRCGPSPRRSSGAVMLASTGRTTSCARRGRSCNRTFGDADVCVFSRDAFVWEGLDPDRVAIITPTIDVFTPKNEDLDAPDGVGGPPRRRAHRRRRRASRPPSAARTGHRIESSDGLSCSRTSPSTQRPRPSSRSRAGTR